MRGAAASSQAARPSGEELYARVLEAARSPELSGDDVDSALLAVLDAIAADPAALDAYGRNAWLAAELALRIHAGEGSDPALEEALRSIPSEVSRSATIWELADAHVASGRLEDAEAIARFGLEGGHAERTIEPRLWHVRAEAARLLGRWESVQEFLDRMEASIPPHSLYSGDPSAAALLAQNHQYRSRLLQARAQILLELGLLDQCRELAQEALAEAEQSGDASALAAARLLAFERALASGAADEAVEIARAGRADERLAPWRRLFLFVEGQAEIERAFEARSRGRDATPAADRSRAALAEALAAGMSRNEHLEAELRLGELERFMGSPDDARAHLERARALALDVAPSEGRSNQSVSLAVLAWRLARQGEAEPDELERSRAELFSAYGRFLEQWQSAPRRPGGIGFLHLAWRTQVVSEAIEAELSASGPGREEAAFARLLQAQVMGTSARERGLSAATLDDVRSTLLADGRGMLVLLPARDRTHLFALDRETLQHYPVPVGRDALRDGARRITAALQRPDGEVDAETLRRLHDDLVPSGARERLRSWSGAITIGFDLLCDLPFGILDGESGTPYCERLALASLPSAVLGVELARRKKDANPAGKDLVLVVASDPPPELELPAFRFGERERERLLAPFAGSAELLDGQRAGRGALLERRDLLRGARVLHFLTHGTTLAQREYSSALVLSRSAAEGERLLAAEDVARLELGGLVVLSACGSGRGPVRTGDDRLVHLGGAFLDAGARCVVLARFPVEYETSLALMERFHARLAADDAPAEALRAARSQRARGEALAGYRLAAFEVLGMGFESALER
jgi:CHAT domain-containing protein